MLHHAYNRFIIGLELINHLKLTASFDQFIQAGNSKHTFRFWNSYLDMVEVLLLFPRGTREGNWNLHLASVRCMLSWIFAYDYINYS